MGLKTYFKGRTPGRNSITMRSVTTERGPIELVKDVRKFIKFSDAILDTDHFLFPKLSHDNGTNIMLKQH